MKIKKIHSKSIFWQLVVFSLMISLIPIFVISSILFQKLENMVVDEMMEYHNQISYQYTENIEEKLMQYQYSLDFISNNTIIIKTLTDQENNPYERGEMISDEVAKSLLLEEKSEIHNCMVYSMVKDIPAYGTSVTMFREAFREYWYKNGIRNTNQWFSYNLPNNRKEILSLIRDVEKIDLNSFEKEQLGIVKLDIDMEQLFTPASAGDSTYDIIVFDDQHQVFYTTDQEKTKVLEQYLEKQKKSPEVYSVRRQPNEIETYVVNETRLKDYGMHILFLFDNKELIQRKTEIQYLVFPMMIGIILLVVGCAYYYSRGFSSRVESLVNKFKRAETGDMTLMAPIGGNDEISVLDQQFSHMLVKLDELIKTNYIQQLEKRETELKNLQLQINPHFLYNTLETISSIAAVKQVFVVCDMCQKLGEIFRYSLGKNHGEFVTLEQELMHTKNYIFIQKIRHGKRFEVFYNVEVDTEKYHIVRFILQPIVENAILHGLSNLTGTGTLEISVYLQDDMLLIKISDDGIGMDEQKVAELNEYINDKAMDKDSKKSIGIKNVNQRIKLSCGEEYGITIKSHPYQGSCFSLWLPIIRGGEKNET